LSGDAANPYAQGVQGLFALYKQNLPYISFSGPTYFAPVINECAKAVQTSHASGQFCYSILLILTDGEICDMTQTKDAIVNASTLPMSIIIVGVGNENFSAMEELDSDNGFLKSSNGRYATRDLV
jgi:hypothetical protein